MFEQINRIGCIVCLGLAGSLWPAPVQGQYKGTLAVNAAQQLNPISPELHGIFFEEISHGGEGGLYAELIQNRGFEEANLPQGTTLQDGFIVPNRTPHWSIPNNGVSDWKMEWPIHSQWPAWSVAGDGIAVALTDQQPLNKITPHSLKVTVAGKGAQQDLINEGFWGINAVSGELYNLSFYARTGDYKGAVKVSLQSADGVVLASVAFTSVECKGWKKFSCVLSPTKGDPKAKLVLSFTGKGTLWVDFVSLFPQHTFKNRPNGMRKDLAQMLADLKPAFIRWPGGCFVEGINIESAPNWKNSLGPIEKRPQAYSPWGYWSSDGFGYYEYLQFCEDIGAKALYVFNIGVSCDFRSGTYLTDEHVPELVQDALDAIEYAIGPVTSKWGKVRASAGHPKPFPLKYVEVGNEQVGARYAKRFNVFYKAIKEKYPQIEIIASMGIAHINGQTLDNITKLDIADEHAYKPAYWATSHFNFYDKYKRKDWKMYVGEYATNAGVGSGNMLATLNDAVYILGMEKNSDLISMCSYAPLLVNEHDVDWPVNLIHFDAGESFARISYYAIKMLNEQKADVNVAVDLQLAAAAVKPPLYKGTIGLATWDTQTEYKDIQVMQDGKVVYRSDFADKPEEWNVVRGQWGVKDSAYEQTAEGAQRLAVLKDHSFDTYTLTLKAKKLGGYNAFIIPFAIDPLHPGNCLRAHIGSYVNVNAAFEKVIDDYEVVGISDPVRLKEKIETGRWYDIKIEVGADKVDCYLDGKLLMSYKEPQDLFAIAGRDEKNGDVIVKVVNTAAHDYDLSLNVAGITPVAGGQTLTVLRADSLTAENSFAHPKQYVPVTTGLAVSGAEMPVTFKPFSVSVVRIKDGGWKKP